MRNDAAPVLPDRRGLRPAGRVAVPAAAAAPVLLWTAAASLFFPWLPYTAQTAGLDAHEARIRMPLFVVPAAACGFAAALFLRLIAWLARPYRPSENGKRPSENAAAQEKSENEI